MLFGPQMSKVLAVLFSAFVLVATACSGSASRDKHEAVRLVHVGDQDSPVGTFVLSTRPINLPREEFVSLAVVSSRELRSIILLIDTGLRSKGDLEFPGQFGVFRVDHSAEGRPFVTRGWVERPQVCAVADSLLGLQPDAKAMGRLLATVLRCNRS